MSKTSGTGLRFSDIRFGHQVSFLYQRKAISCLQKNGSGDTFMVTSQHTVMRHAFPGRSCG